MQEHALSLLHRWRRDRTYLQFKKKNWLFCKMKASLLKSTKTTRTKSSGDSFSMIKLNWCRPRCDSLWHQAKARKTQVRACFRQRKIWLSASTTTTSTLKRIRPSLLLWLFSKKRNFGGNTQNRHVIIRFGSRKRHKVRNKRRPEVHWGESVI